jgi:hypothetical protein
MRNPLACGALAGRGISDVRSGKFDTNLTLFRVRRETEHVEIQSYIGIKETKRVDDLVIRQLGLSSPGEANLIRHFIYDQTFDRFVWSESPEDDVFGMTFSGNRNSICKTVPKPAASKPTDLVCLFEITKRENGKTHRDLVTPEEITDPILREDVRKLLESGCASLAKGNSKRSVTIERLFFGI